MAGHAPELLSTRERLVRWIDETSDFRLSLYMLILACTVAMILYVVDLRLLA